MLATMIPHISMLLRWALAFLMALAATAMAQDVPPVDCSGDDFVSGVTWDVTDDGAENLSADLPTAADEIEAMMKGG